MRIHIALLCTAALYVSADAFAGDPPQVGDFGYKHDQHHESYQKVFAGKCSCGIGDCRVTISRETRLESPFGYDILVDGKWYPVQKEMYRPHPSTLPEDLLNESAHACAYSQYNRRTGRNITVIPCIIINNTQS